MAEINVNDKIALVWQMEDGDATLRLKVLGFTHADELVAVTIVGEQI